MNKEMKKSMCVIIFVWVILFVVFPSMAAEYPSKPVTIVPPWGAGGAIDTISRALAQATKTHLGQPIIVENKPGGGGTVGTSYVLTKPPDGYILGITSLPPTLVSYFMGKLDFHPVDDFTYIMRVCGYFFGIVVRVDAPWKNIQEFIEHCKSNPGKVSYASSGVGSTGHAAFEEFASLAGIKLMHIPYKGGDTNTALLGGHVDAISDASWHPLVEAGKFRLLAIYVEKRSPRYPNIPTVKELGYNMVRPGPINLFGPKGLPKPIVKTIHDAFKMGMNDPIFASALEKFNMPALYLNTEECEKAVRADFEPFKKLVENLGLAKK